MRSLYVLLFSMLASCPADAQSKAPSSSTYPVASNATETARNCQSFYPPVAAQAGLGGLAPTTQQGVALEVDRTIDVQWRISSSIDSEGAIHGCPGHVYPPVAVRLNHEGDTLLSFTVSEDGSPTDVYIAKSSGLPELDEASVNCLKYFRYGRATAKGKSVRYDEKTVFTWRLRE